VTAGAIIRIDGVEKTFDGTMAVKAFDLEIREREFVTLLGPSGCGKTTLLRMIAGLEFPDRGRIVLAGRDITHLPAHKRPVNLVFQRVTLFPHLDVHDNVAFGLVLARLPKREIEERVGRALELVRLPGFARRSVDTLSGGEAQRIALARALVNRPSVLLLDEPLSALDLQIRRQLQVELKEIHRELGRTFVYVTHDQEEAMSMSDRIVVMNEGKIIQIGSPIDVYRKPASLFTASFVGSSNLWPGEIVEAGADGVTIDVGGRRLPARPAPGIRPGDRAWILIRPESIVLSPRPQGGDESPTAVHARVVDVRFVGSIVHYRVTFGDRIITASRPPDDARLFSEGEDVVAKWQGSDALILKE